MQMNYPFMYLLMHKQAFVNPPSIFLVNLANDRCSRQQQLGFAPQPLLVPVTMSEYNHPLCPLTISV